MAILNTPIQKLPYPDENSLINSVDEYIRNLAKALETKLVMVFVSASDRDTTLPAGSRTEGMMAWLQDTNKLHLFDGTDWKQIYPPSPNITTGTTLPSISTGAVGDIYIQYGV